MSSKLHKELHTVIYDKGRASTKDVELICDNFAIEFVKWYVCTNPEHTMETFTERIEYFKANVYGKS